MQVVLDFAVSFLGFIDDLQLFFFSPLSTLPALAASRLGAGEDTFGGTLLESILSGLLSLFPGFANLTLAGLILGAGIIFFLLWRLVKFLVGLFG